MSHANNFCRQMFLRMGTLARWIYLIFNTEELMGLLGVSVLGPNRSRIRERSEPNGATVAS